MSCVFGKEAQKGHSLIGLHLLVQVMAYRLFGAKTVPGPMLIYCQVEP